MDSEGIPKSCQKLAKLAVIIMMVLKKIDDLPPKGKK